MYSVFLYFTVSVLLEYLCSFVWLGGFFSPDREIIHHFGSCSTSWQDPNRLFKVFICCEITSCWHMVQNIYKITWNLSYSVYMKFSFWRLHKPWYKKRKKKRVGFPVKTNIKKLKINFTQLWSSVENIRSLTQNILAMDQLTTEKSPSVGSLLTISHLLWTSGGRLGCGMAIGIECGQR